MYESIPAKSICGRTLNNSLLKIKKYRVAERPNENAIGIPIAKKTRRLINSKVNYYQPALLNVLNNTLRLKNNQKGYYL